MCIRDRNQGDYLVAGQFNFGAEGEVCGRTLPGHPMEAGHEASEECLFIGPQWVWEDLGEGTLLI